MAVPNWIYISNTSGSSGTTTITVSAGTNTSNLVNISRMFFKNSKEDTDYVDLLQKVKGDKNDYYYKYLTFEIISAGTICWRSWDNSIAKTIEYSKDFGDTWTSITAKRTGEIFNVNAGDIIYFRGFNDSYSEYTHYNSFMTSTAIFKVYGNIMSLIDGYNYEYLDSLTTGYTFYDLFTGCKITEAENLILPATTLANHCYHSMFYNCSRLTTAPALPATTLATSCYGRMFYNCSSLTTAPELPATILGQGCYTYMFENCTSLTTAPALPASTLVLNCYTDMFRMCSSLTTAPELPSTTLVTGCYQNMFSGCTNLNYIKCLATDISASACTSNWVYGVASTGTFVKNANMNDWTTGDSGTPQNWNIINA